MSSEIDEETFVKQIKTDLQKGIERTEEEIIQKATEYKLNMNTLAGLLIDNNILQPIVEDVSEESFINSLYQK